MSSLTNAQSVILTNRLILTTYHVFVLRNHNVLVLQKYDVLVIDKNNVLDCRKNGVLVCSMTMPHALKGQSLGSTKGTIYWLYKRGSVLVLEERSMSSSLRLNMTTYWF